MLSSLVVRRADGARTPSAKALGEDLASAQNSLAAKAASDYHKLDHPP
jgi:hypothetical protein